MPTYDLAIVGGGIVGLATAMAWLAEQPGSSIIILEKESALAQHQSTRNSGVIHSGVYYRPGSLKAQTCVEGARLMVAFCRAHGVPHKLCGKLIVATHPSQLPRLQQLHERGQANGVAGLRLLGPEQLQAIEPHGRGLQALHVPTAGVVDYRLVAEAMATLIREQGGRVCTTSPMQAARNEAGQWVLDTPHEQVRARVVVICAGLHTDRIAAMMGAPREVSIIPFRGEYYDLLPARRDLVRALIYPVPDPAFPFLGVHFTRSIDDRVHAGPNAVLAWQREGYRWHHINARDVWSLGRDPGFWRLARKYWRTGAAELYRSWSKAAFVRALQQLVPDVSAADLVPGSSGVRAQAVDRKGAMLDDFDILPGDQAVYVRNVPSPAATASIRIGQVIAGLAQAAAPRQRSWSVAGEMVDAGDGSVKLGPHS